MPHAIGRFISKAVYDSCLYTVHDITGLQACRFIDVSNGREERLGHSWVVSLPSSSYMFFVLNMIKH
jgi:hypothetical protein